MKNQLILFYFLTELIVVICVGFYGPFFKDLTRMYGLPMAMLVYVLLTQIIAISAAVTLQQVRKRKGYILPAITDRESEPAKTLQPVTTKTLPEIRPGRPDSASKVHEVESGSAGVPLSAAERGTLKINFELTHPDFFDKNKKKHPFLSTNEIWLLAYADLKLSTKEIAAILNIDAASVRRAKTRIKRKLRQHAAATDSPDIPAADKSDSG